MRDLLLHKFIQKTLLPVLRRRFINSHCIMQIFLVLILCDILCLDDSQQRDVCNGVLVVNIGPPMSDMSLLSVSMHLSFKHRPVINQATFASFQKDVTSLKLQSNQNQRLKILKSIFERGESVDKLLGNLANLSLSGTHYGHSSFNTLNEILIAHP